MKKKLKPNLMANANILSYLTYWWMNGFFRHGSKNKLEETDMYELINNDKSTEMCSVLERAWQQELHRKDGRPWLARAVAKAYGVRYGALAIVEVVEEGARIVSAILIYFLLQNLENPHPQHTWPGYLYATGITLCAVIIGVTHHIYFFQTQRMGWHLRGASCAMMYKKTLRLSQRSMMQTTTGQIVNLGATDVIRFDWIPLFVHFLWMAPLECAVGAIILWYVVGGAGFVGVGAIVFLMLVQTALGRSFGKLRAQIAVITDQRVRLMNEVIAGMRIVKMYTWEKPFAKLVSDVRRKEITKVLQASALRALNLTTFNTQDKLCSFITLLTFVAMGGTITPSKVFVVIGVFGSLRFSTGLYFPLAIEFLYETRSAFQRIESFLLLEEHRAEESKKEEKSDSEPIIFSDFSARWAGIGEDDEVNKDRLTLKDINIKLQKGQLLAVIGPVGAGKSSLLSAVLRELPPLRGKAEVNGVLSLAEQVPWVFSGTVRENILFGQAYDKDRFEKVIESCSLTQDLEQLPGGDLALVGERGVTLSGGQKARVNLARAAYREDASICLLDDPLSAVNASVANHIFQHCICGVMSNKTRILVTHQVQLLENADQIIILKEGEIAGRGTYAELQAKGTDFATLLKREDEDQPTEKEDRGGVHATSVRSNTLARKPLKRNANRSSTRSIRSIDSIGGMEVADNINMHLEVEEELREQGSIGAKVYIEYFTSGSSYFAIVLYILLAIASHVIYILSDWWLTVWSDANNEIPTTSNTSSSNTTVTTPPMTTFTASGIDNQYYTTVYAVLVVSTLLVMLLRIMAHFYMCVTSGKVMHKKMFRAILRLPIRFFDTNPVGRILNRFAKDMGQIDELLPRAVMDFIYMCGVIASEVVLISIVNYLVILVVLPLIIYFFWLRRYFLLTSRDIKRLEGTSRSPVFTFLTSTMQGLITVRAFRMQDQFEEQFHEHQDLHSACWFVFLTGQRWLGIRLDMMNAAFAACVVFFSMFANSLIDLSPGEIGLITTHAMLICGMFQWGVRQSAETENLMTSVERVQQYYSLPVEAPEEIPDKKPPQGWPSNGSIKFENVSFNYYEGGPVVLKNISIQIFANEKIGIVGRTGAGKSSLISALFRFSELVGGEIYIDGIPISSLGLNDLRGSYSIIPQDPVLFTGTMQRNLDPFSVYTDEEIWDALEQVQLKEVAESLPKKLQTELAESGSNFSVGQRQLFCLARALLKKSKVLIIDEATANVDIRTDQLIQKTIREKFKYCTVLTIAHRLNTIIDSDRILVLDGGRVKEFDKPHTLLKIPGGYFSSMVKSTGATEADALASMANEAFEKKLETQSDG